jgi:hypothetical protein
MRNSLVERIDAHLLREERAARRNWAGAVIGLIAWLAMLGLAYTHLGSVAFLAFVLGGAAAFIAMTLDGVVSRV